MRTSHAVLKPSSHNSSLVNISIVYKLCLFMICVNIKRQSIALQLTYLTNIVNWFVDVSVRYKKLFSLQQPCQQFTNFYSYKHIHAYNFLDTNLL